LPTHATARLGDYSGDVNGVSYNDVPNHLNKELSRNKQLLKMYFIKMNKFLKKPAEKAIDK